MGSKGALRVLLGKVKREGDLESRGDFADGCLEKKVNVKMLEDMKRSL